MKAANKDTLVIHLPPRAATSIDCDLVSLTKYLTATFRELGGGQGVGMGGEYGYGVNYENDVFMIHRYCWCEEDNCPWCHGCKCIPDPEHYLDGARMLDWNEANNRIVAPLPFEVAREGSKAYLRAEKRFDASILERDRRLKTIYPAIIHTCEHAAMLANRDRGDSWRPPQTAPQFWYKPTGLKIWWYKWIGRDMEYDRNPLTIEEWPQIFKGCINSISMARG